MTLPAVIERAPLPAKQDELIGVLNTRHAIIDNVGGKTVIASWEPSPLDPTKQVLVYHTRADFTLRYANRSLTVDDGDGNYKRLPISTWWLKHTRHAQYRGVLFVPGGDAVINDCLNLWRCWGVSPQAGDWSLIYDHILNVVCNGDAESAGYLLRVIAWGLQHPAEQAEVAVVLIGEKGTGKGTFADVLFRIYGVHAFKITGPEELVGKFSGHLQDVHLLIADEAAWGEKYKQCAGRLQGMITERTLLIHPKGLGMFQIRNCLRIVMLAEPGWVIPAGRYERRYAVFDVSDERRRDKKYFGALYAEIEGDGPAAMMHDLLGMNLGDFHPRDIPDCIRNSAIMRQQQTLSMAPMDQWWLAILMDGRLPGATYKHPNCARTDSLRTHAESHGSPGLRRDISDTMIRLYFAEDAEGTKGAGNVCSKWRTSASNGWRFLSLPECRKRFDKFYGPLSWPNPGGEWSAPTQSVRTEDILSRMMPAMAPKPAPAPVAVVAKRWRRF